MTHCFKLWVAMSTKPICIETIKLFRSSFFVKVLNSAVRSHALNFRHDHIFKTSKIALIGLEFLQISVKLQSCGESCKLGLTHSVRVKMASIYSNNWVANKWGVADVSLVNNSFTCEHFWRSSSQIFPNFWKQIFIVFWERLDFFGSRTVQTNVGQVR